MFSTSVPEMEIHMSTEPVGLFILPDGEWVFHKIKKHKGSKFFVKNNKKVRGIFKINSKYRGRIGKTPCYAFVAQEPNSVDLGLIDRLNGWKKANGLTQIRSKDIKHGRKLRTLLRQNEKEPISKIKQDEEKEAKEIKEAVDAVEQSIEKKVETIKKQHKKNIKPSNVERGFILLEYLKEIKKIDDAEYAKYMDLVEKNTYTFDMLLEEMREKHDVQVSEALDLNVEDFIQDLGSQDAEALASFVQDLRQDKKGLKDLTPAPVKSFMPAGILLALMIGIPIAIVVLVPLVSGGNFLGGGGEGGLKMPWDMFSGKFLDALKFW